MAGPAYMDDCVHLHACRRMAKLYRDKVKPKVHVARQCNEGCSAYQTSWKVEAVLLEDAIEAAKDACYRYADGATLGNAVAPQDFETLVFEVIGMEDEQ